MDDSNDGPMDVDSMSLSTISTVDILRVQESTMIKSKERLLGALNRVWAEVSQRSTVSQRRQQTFENSTWRESSGFEYAQT